MTFKRLESICRRMANYRTAEIERFARMFKALSNPNRLRIFLRLTSCCAPDAACSPDELPLRVCEAGGELGVAPSTLSHHIRELREAGVIRVARHGQCIQCWVDAETVGALYEFVRAAAASQPCCMIRAPQSGKRRTRRRKP